MTPDDLGPDALARAGQALFGDRWQTDIARELGIGDSRRVRQWMSGDRSIPHGVWGDIAELLRRRGSAALELADEIEKASSPD
ncbi:hypothetical protein RSO41_12625 [Halomonas sp. I1]|uniref:hypothetical protein n=1 Tax=Halomonas sp. I1 TaxID=393536 RepID=UPI0028E02317|nr:hypothetical protein [Halomonas sp. I1]MDT8895501.1 hypothetical protein [Halomonas sp. I1]